MKKTLFILFFIAPIFFAGCKEEQDEQKKEPTFSLVGKKYSGADPVTNIIYGNCVDVYRFINDSIVEISTRKNNYNGNIERIKEVPYSSNYPSTLIIDNYPYQFIDEQTFRKNCGTMGIAEFVRIN